MEFKEFFIKKILVSYFLSVTGITAAIGLLGSVFAPEARFGYQAFLSPFLFGLVAAVPSLALYSKKELPVKQLLFRLALHFILLETLILLYAFVSGLLTSVSVALSMFAAVLIIDVTVHLVHWLSDRRTAGALNEALRKMQLQEE
jgi:hypothetical protein